MINMDYMFKNSNFTTLPDFSTGDMSNTESATHMFNGCLTSDPLDLSSGDMSNMYYFSNMFTECQATTITLNNWKFGAFTERKRDLGVANPDPEFDDMFENYSGNLILNGGDFPYVWQTGEIGDIFDGCKSTNIIAKEGNFDLNIDGSISGLFSGCKYTETLDVTGWKTSKLKNMRGAFEYFGWYLSSPGTIIGLDTGDTSNVKDMVNMFRNAKVTSIDLSSWAYKSTKLEWIANMFDRCSATTINITGLVTNSVDGMTSAFVDTDSVQRTIIGLDTGDVSNVQYMNKLFEGYAGSGIDLSAGANDLDRVTDMDDMFYGCTTDSINLDNWKLGYLCKRDSMFDGCTATISKDNSDINIDPTISDIIVLEEIITPAVNEIVYIDNGDGSTTITCKYIAGEPLDLSFSSTGIITTNVSDMNRVFAGCTASEIDASGGDTSNVLSMEYAFSESLATTINISGGDTSRVWDMSSMFLESSVTTIIGLSDLDTSNVEEFYRMFENANVTLIDVSSGEVSKSDEFSYMFKGCQATTLIGLDNGNIDSRNGFFMEEMFRDSMFTNPIDLTSWKWYPGYRNGIGNMFNNSKTTSINLSGGDTSGIGGFGHLFANAAATSINVSGGGSGDNAWGIGNIFEGCNVDVLDLSTWNVTDPFPGWVACEWFTNANTTKVLVRTQADKEYFEGLTSNPEGLVFEIK